MSGYLERLRGKGLLPAETARRRERSSAAPAEGEGADAINAENAISPLVWDDAWQTWLDPREREALSHDPFTPPPREPGQEG
jgi:hypothetical protein